VDQKYMQSHLRTEVETADSPFGLQVIVDTTKKRDFSSRHIDSTVWQIGSITWTVMNLFLDNDVDMSMAQAEKVINHWRLKLNDQWDYRDLTAVWNGDPYCNSHYARQLIFWSIPMALAGQNYSVTDQRLSFNPKIKAPYRLPFYTPQANGVLEAKAGKPIQLRLIAGKLKLKELVISGKIAAKDISMVAGNSITLDVASSAPSQTSDLKTEKRFLETLRNAKVMDACKEMGIDFDEVFAPMATGVKHPYHRYRWSVTRDEKGNPVIHALPPEEEMGWTPWERWSIKDGKPVRTDWVQFPIQQPVERGVIHWYILNQSGDLTPRYMKSCKDLEAQLRLARVDVAADWLGLDFQKIFVESLSAQSQEKYRQFRWVVIPHVLAADGPVIYALPPMHKSDDWPWHSWYTDGKTPRILHIHYTAQKPRTTGSWSENPGAPQRPPEIYGHIWYWYDDPEIIPALLQ